MNNVTRRALLAGGGMIGIAAAGVGGLAGRNWLRDREPPALPTQDAKGRLVWSNWSGIAHSYPERRAAPRSEDELLQILRTAPGPIRPVGSGHSFTALVPTDGTLLTLDALAGVLSHDAATNQATVWAGTRLFDLGPALAAVGQEMSNLPDINKQSVAGAMSTGTHGTGKGIKAVHGNVIAMRLATPTGELIECDAQTRTEVFNAARAGVGAFGIITQVTLQNRPLTRVVKRSQIRKTAELIEDWPNLRERHRNVEFFPLPFSNYAMLVTHDETDKPVVPRGPDTDSAVLMGMRKIRDWLEFAPALRTKYLDGELSKIPATEVVDEGWKLLSNERTVRFNEMEYHIPIENHMVALREVLTAIETHRRDVFYPLEARVIAPDDAWLSPFYQRECGSIAVHAYVADDYDFFFSIVEPIFRRHGGRPHWGKLHSLKARDLAQIYPRWKEAGEMRATLDPQGRMLNPYLKGIFLNG